MKIFTRFKDIIHSNINAMLDNVEDPKKMITQIIQEMETTLVDVKSSCAGTMATCKRIKRQIEEAHSRENLWEQRAIHAISKNRDDLAKKALQEKRRFTQQTENLIKELSEHDSLVGKYKNDIRQLEDKLSTILEKQRLLMQRHIHARRKKQAQQEIRRIDSTDTIIKFDKLESRVEQIESEAGLVNFGRKSKLDEKFDDLLTEDAIEKELLSLKLSHAG